MGARLAELRKKLGMDQATFGEIAGVIYQTVSDWENEHSKPSRSRLRSIANALRIPLECFAEGGPRPADFVSAVASENAGEGGPMPLEAVNAAVHERPRAGRLVIAGRVYATPYGVSAREAIDRIIDDVKPEHVPGVAEIEVADTFNRGEPLNPKRMVWWIHRAFEAGQRSATTGAASDPIAPGAAGPPTDAQIVSKTAPTMGRGSQVPPQQQTGRRKGKD